MAEQMNIFFCSVFTNEDCSNLPEAENSYNGDDPLVDTDITEEMECIVRYAIVNRLKKNNIIRSSQHGFMAGRSWITNLLEYLEDLTHLVDQGQSVDIVYLDFAKAFNKVPRRWLIMKCAGLGISGKV